MSSFEALQGILQKRLSDTALNDSRNSRSNNRSGHIFPVNFYVLPQGQVPEDRRDIFAYTRDGRVICGVYALAGIDHSGRCVLIGGMRDASDADCAHTAERETEEEIKIKVTVKKENEMIVNGSPVFVVDATGWSSKKINTYIQSEGRRGSQFNEIKEVVWIRVDRGLTVKDRPNFQNFQSFVNLARRHFRYEIKNGRIFKS